MDDDEMICSRCNGTGEGMHDGTVCRACKGSGVVKEDLEDAEYERADRMFDEMRERSIWG